MDYNSIIWIVVCVIMLIVEFATFQLVSVWFAFGAAIAFIASFFLPFNSQIIIFVVVSFISLLGTMPFISRYKNKKHIPTNYDMDIGKDVKITERIDKTAGTGRAVLNDVNWMAESENPDETFENGEVAVVKDIKGARLIVAKK